MSSSAPREELTFADICNALRRNDPSMFFVDASWGSVFPRGYGAALGEALRDGGNSPLRCLTLNVFTLLDLSDTSTVSATSLLQFIRESRDLHTVRILTDRWRRIPDAELTAERRLLPVITELARQLILAIAQNPAIKEEVELSFDDELYMPMTEFTTLLSSSTSMDRFIVHTANFPSVAAAPEPFQEPPHTEVIGNKSIRFMMIYLSSRTTIPETVLTSMGYHTRLRELYVSRDANDIALPCSAIKALASLLRTTRTLEELGVSCPLSSSAAMEYLVEGLHANQTIHTLSLDRPDYIALDARQVFINYMQSPVQGHSPRRLRIADSDGPVSTESGSFAVALLPTTPYVADGSNEPARPRNTVGSALQVLELTGHNDRVQFFQALTAHADRIRLPCLEFKYFREATCPLLQNCLPRLAHVRKLVLPSFMVYPGEALDFVRALKANVSLCEVVIDFGTVPMANLCQRFVQAYCQRNTALQTLLLRSNDTDSNLVDHVNQVPNVFGTALQVPLMTHNAMIKALKALDQRLMGRDNRNERARLAVADAFPASATTMCDRLTKKEPRHNMTLRSRAKKESSASVPCQPASQKGGHHCENEERQA